MSRKWIVTCMKVREDGQWNAYQATLTDPWNSRWVEYGPTRQEAIQKVIGSVRGLDASKVEGVAA